MSTYRSTLTARKGTGLAVQVTRWTTYCVLCGLAILFFIQATPVVASTTSVAQQDTPEYLARPGVSVVRIVVTYAPQPPQSGASPSGPAKNGSPNPPTTFCSGLGMIVASAVGTAGNTTEPNATIVTDGSLLNATCASLPKVAGAILVPNTITVYFSNTYSTTAAPVTIMVTTANVRCGSGTIEKNCGDGAALLSFHSATLLPVARLSGTNTTQNAYAILLNKAPAGFGTPSSSSTPQQNLMPTAVLNGNSFTDLERGTPVVDPLGDVKGFALKDTVSGRLFDATALATLLKNSVPNSQQSNDVSTNWHNGIDEYYQGSTHLGAAKSDFTKAYTASNNQFQGAQTFAALATAPASKPDGGNSSNNGFFPSTIGGFSSFLLVIIAVCLLIFVALLILLQLLLKRGQRRKDLADADMEATVAAKQIRAQEAQQAQLLPQPAPAWSRKTVKQDPPLAQKVASHPEQQVASGVSSMPVASFSAAPIASVAPVQANGFADMPTIDMGASASMGPQDDTEKTVQFPVKIQRSMRGGGQMDLEVITSTDPGIKRQYKPNEDSLVALKGVRMFNGQPQQIGLFVVADGMGGHANGQDASRLAIQTIIDYVLPRLMREDTTGETPEKLLVDSVQQANHAVHQHNIDNGADMGTTVTATLVIDTMAHVANVGDSRTYLYRTNDGLSKVTRDHSVVASLVDAGIIKPDDIYTHPKRNQIYRSLGEKPFVEVDPFEVQLQPGDKLLLCSDGLWDMVRDPEIKRVLEASTADADPRQLGPALIKAAHEGGGDDNISVVVINVVEHAPRQLKPGLEPVYVQKNVHMPEL